MSTPAEQQDLQQHGLYDPAHEHDACGVGFVAHIKGEKSHAIVTQALKILENLDHRGAVGADKLMGDGAGILIQMPDKLYREEMAKQGVKLPPPGEYGVGMIFLPKEHASRLACEEELERAIKLEGQVLLGWRDVPVNRDMPMSPTVRAKEPIIRQVFIGRGHDVIVQDALERKLYVIRKTASAHIQALGLRYSKEYYVPSMSSRTVIYKGLLLADQVGTYYRDLEDERCVSALGLVHQRFSTNTFPEWPLAHPYRYVAHNGEINTVKGNYNWMRAREGVMSSPVLGADLKKLYPISFPDQSDTATFDNCIELLTMAGYPLAQAAMMMIPEPWEQHTTMDERRRAFYEYHASMLEPWDGPASIVFTDGRQIGATLDRNGLRPARYCVTDDDIVIMGSESGVLPIPEHKIVKKWRLQPGKMFLIDLEQGRMIDDEEVKASLANAKPYKRWIEDLRIRLDDVVKPVAGMDAEELPIGETEPQSSGVETTPPAMLDLQQAFGYTQEDIKFLMSPMAVNGEEGIGSMGNDSPLAVLSDRTKPLFNYFKQLFAQVTNPPIDPIREAIVMSLVSFIGPKPNLLDINQVNPPMRLEVSQPVLDATDMVKLRDIAKHTQGKFSSAVLDITYPLAWGPEGVEARLASLCAQAVDAIKGGANILIISDKGVGRDRLAIPALLALSAIHQHLIREGLRQVLSFAPDLEVVGAHADPEALLSAVDTQAPDVVMTDIRMPPTHTDEGMQVAERLRITHPAVGVVVLSLVGRWSSHHVANFRKRMNAQAGNGLSRRQIGRSLAILGLREAEGMRAKERGNVLPDPMPVGRDEGVVTRLQAQHGGRHANASPQCQRRAGNGLDLVRLALAWRPPC